MSLELICALPLNIYMIFRCSPFESSQMHFLDKFKTLSVIISSYLTIAQEKVLVVVLGDIVKP